jgi:hypothetical protein
MRQVSRADARMVIAGVVERVVTEPLQQPCEGAACVPTLEGQRGSFGRQPSLASLTKRIRVAVSEAVALAQRTHQSKGANFMPLCSGGTGQGRSIRGDATQRYQRAQKKKSALVMGVESSTLGACAALIAHKKGSYLRVGRTSWTVGIIMKRTGHHPAYKFVSFLYTIDRLLTGMQKF